MKYYIMYNIIVWKVNIYRISSYYNASVIIVNYILL